MASYDIAILAISQPIKSDFDGVKSKVDIFHDKIENNPPPPTIPPLSLFTSNTFGVYSPILAHIF